VERDPLRLSGLWFDLEPSTDTDPYITFKLFTSRQPLFNGSKFTPGHVYYQQLEDGPGLIDIELDVHTGRFVELTIIDLPPETDVSSFQYPSLTLSGLPIFSRHDLVESRASLPIRRIKTAMSVIQRETDTVILLNKRDTVDKVIEFGDIRFIFEANELSAIAYERK